MSLAAIVDRVKLIYVEIAFQISFAYVCKAIETSIKTFKEPILRKLAAPIASVVSTDIYSGNVPVTGQSARRHVPLIKHQLKDSVISRQPHPLRRLAHLALNWANRTHMYTGIRIKSRY
ncbi:hypothetical protein [Natrinema halophilum]|uniref:hypothetical protein n=1 Tax=Natrinema halophilum TaxID=1699371 RepID=UPI0031BB641D